MGRQSYRTERKNRFLYQNAKAPGSRMPGGAAARGPRPASFGAPKTESEATSLLFKQSNLHFERKEYTEAAACLQRLIEIDPRHRQAINRLIRLYSSIGEFPLAETCYKYAKNNGLANLPIQTSMCNVYLAFERYPEAWAIFEQIKKELEIPYFLTLIKIMLGKGRFAHVISWIEAYPPEKSENIQIQEKFIECLRKAGRLKEALWIAESLLESMPEDYTNLDYTHTRVLQAYCQAELGNRKNRNIRTPETDELEKEGAENFLELYEKMAPSNPDYVRIVCGRIFWVRELELASNEVEKIKAQLQWFLQNGRRYAQSEFDIRGALEMLEMKKESGSQAV